MQKKDVMILNRSDLLSQDILHQLPAGVFILRQNYTVSFWNRCLQEWTGITADQIVGAGIFTHFPYLDSHQYRNCLQNIFAGGTPVVFSSPLHQFLITSSSSDKPRRIQQTTVKAIPAQERSGFDALFLIEDLTDLTQRLKSCSNQKPKALATVNRDEQKNNALGPDKTDRQKDLDECDPEVKKLRELNEKLVQTVGCLLIIINHQERIIHLNPLAEKILGINYADSVGKQLNKCNIDWPQDKITRAVERCRREKQIVRLDALTFAPPNGREKFLDLTLHPLLKDQADAFNILILAVDITDRKIMETQFNQALKLAAVGKLASGIAHEINTPTQYVGDNTQFLQDSFDDIFALLKKYEPLLPAAEKGTVDPELLLDLKQAIKTADLPYLIEEIPRAIRQSQEGIKRVTDIVRAMKDFAHPGTDEKTPTDINKAIASTITVARNVWKYVADVTTDYDEKIGLVPCLRGEFNQAILNVIVNAADAITEFMDNGKKGRGLISITTRRDDKWAEIRISDTGGGIPPDVQPKIYDAFFTTKKIGKGSGQGLALTRSFIVEKHGGTIDFQTQMGKGATFIIRLPLESKPDDKNAEL